MLKRVLFGKNLYLLFFLITICIIIHHYFKHKNDTDLDLLSKFVQWEDINNHETVALFFFGIGIGLYIAQCLI